MTYDLATPVPSPLELVRSTRDIGSPAWWLERLSLRLASRAGRAPGTKRPHQRGQSMIDDPGSEGMTLFDAYYRGNHRQTYKIRKVISAFGLRMPLFVNYCGVVVDTLAERIAVSGFNFHDDEAASEAANEIWQANNLDAGFNRGVREGLTKGEFSVSVWPGEDGAPRICIEDPLETIVAIDPANHGDRRAALKLWVDPDAAATFATLYLPDFIFKFRADQVALTGSAQGSSFTAAARAWRPRIEGDEPWPLPNAFEAVPIFPIPNRPDIHGVGMSELEEVLPIQDAINANIANVMLAGLYGAFRQKWATNFTPDIDPKTNEPMMPWNISEDSIFTSPPPPPGQQPTQFGEFDQSELSGYVSLHETYVQALATSKRLPPHYLLGSQGTFPSGESLTAAERGLAEKARERGTDMKDPLEDAQRFAFLIQSKNESLSSAARARFAKWAAMVDAAAIFRDPESHTESQHIDALGKLKALGVPLEIVLARVPFTPAEIRQIMELRKAEAAATARLEASLPPDPATDPTAPPVPGGPIPPQPAVNGAAGPAAPAAA